MAALPNGGLTAIAESGLLQAHSGWCRLWPAISEFDLKLGKSLFEERPVQVLGECVRGILGAENLLEIHVAAFNLVLDPEVGGVQVPNLA